MSDPHSTAPVPSPRRRVGRPAGRRAGDTTTRDRILDSARQHFARGSYSSTTIRAIAADADVNPALVIHYFGSKRDLFGATLRLPLHLRDQVSALIRTDPDDMGEHVVRLFLTAWRDQNVRTPLSAMIRSVFSDEGAADALGQFLATHLLGPLVAASRRDRPELRVSLAASHLAGLVIGRHILGVAPLARADIEQLVACVGPVIQHYLTGRLPAVPTE
ncbi:TetR/AcrR family transcriptional regulator [Streptomyces thermodiastaticus]|uniref:TetR/AcrR family transcriptional regulator n=1 Tax=Streptomyces thermodiastaticus TaxID=44061 RepID=UPI001674C7BE|nr:TetR family transcriptional regulator [Streptomyces thermodiastaticus]MCE7548948.1 TetR family transcriptional regulator [Streptomyces thermodiastaticus]GHF75530.1 TetR family transcriptional regulator [Streptomyces thermodiastaticus]